MEPLDLVSDPRTDYECVARPEQLADSHSQQLASQSQQLTDSPHRLEWATSWNLEDDLQDPLQHHPSQHHPLQHQPLQHPEPWFPFSHPHQHADHRQPLNITGTYHHTTIDTIENGTIETGRPGGPIHALDQSAIEPVPLDVYNDLDPLGTTRSLDPLQSPVDSFGSFDPSPQYHDPQQQISRLQLDCPELVPFTQSAEPLHHEHHPVPQPVPPMDQLNYPVQHVTKQLSTSAPSSALHSLRAYHSIEQLPDAHPRPSTLRRYRSTDMLRNTTLPAGIPPVGPSKPPSPSRIAKLRKSPSRQNIAETPSRLLNSRKPDNSGFVNFDPLDASIIMNAIAPSGARSSRKPGRKKK